MDVPRIIRDYNRGRDPQRLAMKLARMRADPFGFLRGSCHLFYRRLPQAGVLAKAPAVWVCGDLHLENFGSYKGDDRLAYFDVNDFDEAALAPCTWDLVRLLASVRLGLGALKLSAGEVERLCGIFVDAYAQALARGKARWLDRDTSEGVVRTLLTAIRARSRPQFLDSRSHLKGRRRVLRIDGVHALPADDDQRQRVTAFMEGFAARQANPQFFRVLDVARRIAGTGSLGVDRYVILVRGRGSPDGNFLLDLKQALPSSLVPRATPAQPKWKHEAARVVAVQRRMQAVSMAFLQAVEMGGASYVLRALQPSEDRVALQHWRGRTTRIEHYLADIGAVVAWDHLRAGGRDGSAIADELIDFGARRRWRQRVAQIAAHCAAQVRQDWQAYAQAFDDSYFTPDAR